MKISVFVKSDNPKGYETVKRENVWEIQNNDGTEIVLKYHNHECERISKDKIIKLIVSSI